MKSISGSSGRSLLLLITNILLMVLGAIIVAAGSISLGIFLLHLFTFASQLFVVVPALLITSGTLTIIVAIFGLGLFKRKYEASGVFLAYASIIGVAFLISLSASVTSFVLREAIAHRFKLTDVGAQLNLYSTDPYIRSRWDTIQREFRCCGGYNIGTGYQDWEEVSIEPLPIGASPAALNTFGNNIVKPSLTRVPDSCCIRERLNCGEDAFLDRPSDSSSTGVLNERIYVNGCMYEVRNSLFKHVMPLLLICALVSLIVGLIELLLLLCAVCFADHIKRLGSIDGSSTIGRSSSLSQEKQGIIQDNFEEKPLEYSLDNANPGFYDGDGLLGNEDDSVSWYDSSTTDTRIRHQLPLLEGSPSLRKNRFFFQNGSQADGYELQSNLGTEGPDSIIKNGVTAQASNASASASKGQEDDKLAQLGLFAFFAQIFGKKKSDYTMRNKELSLREDALDREATLMNVLKSVNQKSEPDLVEVTKETTSSTKTSGFNWFRSKSKENVLDQPDNSEVKKLPTLEDKTIDKNKKYPPMENLTDAGKKSSARSGLQKLKRIRDEMFKKRHQSLKEEDENKQNQENSPAETIEVTEKTEDPTTESEEKKEEIDFKEQKKDKDQTSTQSSSESSSEGSGSSSESDAVKDKAERKQSNTSSSTRKNEDSTGSKVERKSSQRSVHYEEDQKRDHRDISPKKSDITSKTSFKTGIPIRGSTFQRSVSETSEEPAMRSLSPNQQRLRVSGFGVSPASGGGPANPPPPAPSTRTRHLSTIHEPHLRSRTRSLQVTSSIPIDPLNDNEVEQFNNNRQNSVQFGEPNYVKAPGSPTALYNRSLSPQQAAYYVASPTKLSRVQQGATRYRSEEQLAKPPVQMVEYLRPVGILTNNQNQGGSRSPPPGRPGSAQGYYSQQQQSRDNSQDSTGHVTRIKVEENNEEEDRRDSKRKSSRDKEDSRSRDRSDSRKKTRSRSRDHDKKKNKNKKNKKKNRSASRSSSSESSGSGSDSESDSETESSDSGSDSDGSGKRKRNKSGKSSGKDKKSSKKESKSSKKSKKSKKHRSDDPSPDKKHRKSSSKSSNKDKERRKNSGKRNEENEQENFETNQMPPQNQQRPQPGVMYDNPEYMNSTMPRMPPGGNPYDSQQQQGYTIVEDPRAGYFSTATLPSNAALRKPSGPGPYVVQYSRATSEPRTPKKVITTSNTLDRHHVMANNGQRSQSAERVPIKYRRVSLDPTAYQNQTMTYAGAGADQRGQRMRSVSMAHHEAGDIHVLNSPQQMYRTAVEMEPNAGDIYGLQQQQRRMSKSNSRAHRMSVATEEMIQHRRPTHVAEARYHDTEF